MRCQKVRSYLPTYCRGELPGREVLAVREHLASCASCRTEEVELRALSSSARELAAAPMSADFNTRLLNRIAKDRFAETRSKAYFPRPAPRLMWRRAVPALASTAILAVVAVGLLAPKQQGALTFSFGSRQLDDSYLTVQPYQNPNMTASLSPAWSLESHLAQRERIDQLSGMLTNTSGFTNVYSRSNFDWNDSYRQYRNDDMLRPRPIFRVYQPSNTTAVTEERTIY